MNFAEIRRTVEDIWAFCWPPFLAVCLSYWVLAFVYPTASSLPGVALAELQARGAMVVAARKALEPYGLSSAVPLCLFAGVIGTLFLINHLVIGAAAMLPPHFSFQPDVLLRRQINGDERTLLARRYPTVRSFNSAYFMALREFSPLLASIPDRALIHRQVHALLKLCGVSALIALCLALVHRQFDSIVRFGFLSSLLVVAWAVVSILMLSETDHYYSRQWSTIRLQLQSSAAETLKGSPTASEKRIARPVVDRQWWRLRFFSTDPTRWAKMFLFQPRHRPRRLKRRLHDA
jgi:hypothetical protein